MSKQLKQNQNRNRPKGGPRISLPSPWDDLRATGRTAGRALSVIKGAVSMLNTEVKVKDTSQGSTAVPDTGLFHLISGVAQGDTQVTRDGGSIKCKGGLCKIYLSKHASATLTRIRVLIFMDMMNAAANPTAADFYNSSEVLGLQNVITHPNRYVFLYDHTVLLDAVKESQTVLNIPLEALKEVHFTFRGTGATVASCGGPTCFLYLAGSEATNTPASIVESRIFFVDN
jgi:hypothetical protein